MGHGHTFQRPFVWRLVSACMNDIQPAVADRLIEEISYRGPSVEWRKVADEDDGLMVSGPGLLAVPSTPPDAGFGA
jgi:hypothetical protein